MKRILIILAVLVLAAFNVLMGIESGLEKQPHNLSFVVGSASGAVIVPVFVLLVFLIFKRFRTVTASLRVLFFVSLVTALGQCSSLATRIQQRQSGGGSIVSQVTTDHETITLGNSVRISAPKTWDWTAAPGSANAAAVQYVALDPQQPDRHLILIAVKNTVDLSNDAEVKDFLKGFLEGAQEGAAKSQITFGEVTTEHLDQPLKNSVHAAIALNSPGGSAGFMHVYMVSTSGLVLLSYHSVEGPQSPEFNEILKGVEQVNRDTNK